MDSYPYWDESDLARAEVVLEIQEICLGPVGRYIDEVVAGNW